MIREKSDSILIAEDDSILQFTSKMQVQRYGYKVELVENGQLAAEAGMHKEYALILMDIHMPILNGLEAAAAIRKFEQDNNLPATPIVAVTADPDKLQCLESGMQDYLMKPLTLLALEEILKTYARTGIDGAGTAADE